MNEALSAFSCENGARQGGDLKPIHHRNMTNPESVTQLLAEWRAGDEGALERLTPLVYEELRKLARRYMQAERIGHTLQPTAVVHEAFERLIDMDVSWKDRAHFYAVAARLMRRILVDHAKGHLRAKRGAGATKMSLTEGMAGEQDDSIELLEIDRALSRLSEFDERKSAIIELHYFGGLTYNETAEALEISPATVHRDLRLAKAWMLQEIQG